MNPTGYHITNLLLHVAASLLIWVTLRKLSLPGAFWAVMIFSVHPVNVESVAWIAQRKGLLAMLFFLLSILCYLRQFSTSCGDNAQRSRHTPCAGTAHGVCGLLTGRWYWLSLVAFVLAMLSKGSVAVMPVLLLGIVWWLRPLTKWDLVRTAPFFVVAVVLAGVNVWFQTHGTGVEYRSVGFVERLLGAGTVVWFYLYKAILPLNLAFVYPQWRIESGNLLWWLPLMAALVVTAVLWRYRAGWSRPLLFAWGFFCVALAPVLGFIDVGFMQFSPVADHYQHIALIGVIALAAAGWSRWHERTRGAARWAANVAALVVLCALMSLAWQQSRFYSDAITLYQATLEKNPACPLLHNNLGFVLIQENRPQEAIEHCQQALRLEPNYADAHNNLGTALDKTGRLPEAMEHYRQALLLKPDYPQALFNLGGALVETGRLSEAIEHYRQALLLKPYFPEAHNNLGYALANTDQLPEAIEHYQQALRLKPDFPEAHDNLGLALAKAGRPREAIEQFQQVLRLKPDNANAHNNLGLTLANTGRLQEAVEHYNQALRLKPNYPEANNNLGNALLRAGRMQEAIEHYRQAIQFDPNFPEACFNLGIALMQVGQLQEASENFRQVLRLKPNDIEAYYNLALAYARLQQSSQAIATVQKALELAQSQGQTSQAKQIEEWLNSYRASLSKLPNATPAVESASPPH